MIRLTFHPLLNITPGQLDRLSAKLLPLSCKSLIESTGQAFIFIETNQSAGNLAFSLPKIKNYVFCDGCNSLHFRTEENVKESFICLCGKVLNKKK